MDTLVALSKYVSGKTRPKEEEFHNISSLFASVPFLDVIEEFTPKR